MDGVSDFSIDRSSLVDRVANDVHDPAQCLWADWNTDGSASVDDLLTADQTLGWVHGDGSDTRVAEMLGNFEDETVFDSLNFEGV